MSDVHDQAEEILAAFAIEPAHDRATLDRYLRMYPELYSELLDLALELELPAPVVDMDVDAIHSPAADAAWAMFSGRTTPARVEASSFAGELASQLGVRRSVIVGLRDRKVRPETLTAGFLGRLSTGLKSSLDAVLDYLSAPSTMQAGASFKSRTRPETTAKVSIQQLLEESGHTPDEIASILKDD